MEGFVADLHIHSRFARACSKDLTVANLAKWGKIKGTDLLGTGDFTHPEWLAELKRELTPLGNGLFEHNGQKFLLQTEISLVYTHAGKGRRVHHVVLAPSFDVVDQIVAYLGSKGRLDYDGRPIFKIPSSEFVYELKKISRDIEVIPAHVWTPWFAILGSKSGYDSVQECFEDQSKHIHAIETGLSSDPLMNWRVPSLDKYNLVSFSDSHSFWPWRFAREATLFKTTMDYQHVLQAIRTGEGLSGTLEVDPNYGKYHIDGHRACGVEMHPDQTKKVHGICPKCNKPLTLGVLGRVEALSSPDRPEGFAPKGRKPFQSLLPLSELIALRMGKGVATKGVWEQFWKLQELGNELDVLRNCTPEELARHVDAPLQELILKNREGKIPITPGYDGEYGIPQWKTPPESKEEKGLNKYF